MTDSDWCESGSFSEPVELPVIGSPGFQDEQVEIPTMSWHFVPIAWENFDGRTTRTARLPLGWRKIDADSGDVISVIRDEWDDDVATVVSRDSKQLIELCWDGCYASPERARPPLPFLGEFAKLERLDPIAAALERLHRGEGYAKYGDPTINRLLGEPPPWGNPFRSVWMKAAGTLAQFSETFKVPLEGLLQKNRAITQNEREALREIALGVDKVQQSLGMDQVRVTGVELPGRGVN